MALQLRRGTNKERLQMTPLEGELIFVTDYELVTKTATTIASNLLTFNSEHGFSVGDKVRFISDTQKNLVFNTVYYVIADGLTTTACKLSTTAGGNAVTLVNGTLLNLQFAVSPTDAALTPVGTSVSALWVGDGSTVGGITSATQSLNDIADVEITSVTDSQVLAYSSEINKWINTYELDASTGTRALMLTRKATSDDDAYESRAALRINKRITDVANNDNNHGGPSINFYRSYGTQTADQAELFGHVAMEYMGATSGNDVADNHRFAVRVSTDQFTEVNDTYPNTTNLIESTPLKTRINEMANSNYAVVITNDNTTASVGINTNSPTYPLHVVGNMFSSGSIYANGDLILNNDGGGNDVTITFTGGRTLKWDHGDQRYEFNTGDLYLTSDLILGGNDIKSSAGDTAITLSGTNVTIAGNLTVNGTTTTVNSTTLTVDDKNIELASTATPSDIAADGGGITLKGDTDKKIFWQNSDDRWYFDNGNGTNRPFVYLIDDIADVTLTSVTKGDLLYYNGTAWVNEPLIQFDSTAQRTRFQFNTTASGVRAGTVMIKNTGGTAYTDGDGSGILVGVDSDSQAINTFAGLSAVYNSAGNHEVRLRTSTDSFATNEKNILTVNDDDLKVKAAEFVLNALGTGSAGVDAQITVERGTTGADSYLKWDESVDQWEFSNSIYTPGNIGANGNLTLNVDSADEDVTINFKVLGGTNETLTWNKTTDQFEFSDRLKIAGTVEITGNEIKSSTGATAITLNGNSIEIAGDATIGDDLTVNGDEIRLLGAQTSPGTNASIVVERGTNDVAIRWNETDDRWETTTNGSTYIQLPNQGLDTDDTPTFAGLTGGNVRVGVTGDNEIDTSTGNLTIDSAGGTVAIDDDLTVSGGMNVNSGVLFVDAANNRVGVNTVSPTEALEVNGDIKFTNATSNIKFNTGTTAIGLSGNGVTLNSLIVQDNKIRNSGIFDAITFESGSNPKVTLAGDLQINGNEIKSSTGATAITLFQDDAIFEDAVDIKGILTFRDVNSTGTGLANQLSFKAEPATTSQFELTTTARNLAKLLVFMTDGTNEHCVEILAMRTGTGSNDALITTYGEMYSASALATFAAGINGSGELTVYATPASTAVDFSVVRTALS
jgi:hypothetical protein